LKAEKRLRCRQREEEAENWDPEKDDQDEEVDDEDDNEDDTMVC